MALVIKDAVKLNLKARIALLAPTGGGKTFTLLKFLFTLVKLGMAKKVGVVDTEHGSASKYIGEFPAFRVIEMTDDFSPEQYIEALQMLAEDGCDAVGIDSLTHAWAGKGGSLELKDKFGRQKGFNDYTAWGPVTAMQNRLIESMLSYPGHLVTTMRLKMEHVLEEDPITKKKVVRKIGLQPVQRDGLEYEFDLVGDLDQDHNFSVSKTRCSSLDGYAVNKPGEEVIRKMKDWLESGEAAQARAKPAPAKETIPAGALSVTPPAASQVAQASTPLAAAVVPPAAIQTIPDAAETSTVPAATAQAEQPANDKKKIADLFEAAATMDELDAAAQLVTPAQKQGRLTDKDRSFLVELYLARQEAFTKKAVA